LKKGMAMSANRAVAGVYGRNLGMKFGAEDAPCILTRSLQCEDIAVTEVFVDRPPGRLSDPLPRVNAYMICLLISDLPNNVYWEGGREIGTYSVQAGQSTIHDLQREPLALMDKPFRTLLFYLPCAALGALADEANVPRISELCYKPGVPIFDETIRHIGLALLPVLRTPERTNRLLTDYLALAFATHTAQSYGGMQTVSRPLKGGLAPWQESRSKEMIGADLTGATPLREIAKTCGLSTSHFSRAFRKSTGLAPHAWLIQTRVESAKAMLRKRDASLFTIARACGFADQSHFARVFKRRVGLSPGAWRKIASG
jgi:AraC family transcriptional regulator